MASDVVIRFKGDAASAILAGRQTEAAIGRLDGVSARTGASISSRLGGALAGFARVGLLAVGSVSTAFAGMTIYKGAQRAIAIDDAERKLEGLGYTAQQVAEITDNALQAVLGTPYSLAEAMTVATTAIAAGIEPGRELSRYLAIVADTATIAGGSLGEVGSVLNKATANQRVYTDVLNQLADRGLPVFSWLQKQYDVSGDKLRRMVQRGEVDSRTLIRVLRNNIGGAAQKAGEGIRGSFANLITAIARLGDALVGPIFGSVPQFLQSLRRQVDTLAEHIRPIGEALGAIFKDLQDADGFKARVGIVLESAGGALEELLFGHEARRTRVPVDARHWEWHVEGATDGLVGAIGQAIRDINWTQVGKEIAAGFGRATRAARPRIQEELDKTFADKLGLSESTFAKIRGPSGIEVIDWVNRNISTPLDHALSGIDLGPSGIELGRRFFGALGTESAHAATRVGRSANQIETHLGSTASATRTFAGALSEHLSLIGRSADRGIEQLRARLTRIPRAVSAQGPPSRSAASSVGQGITAGILAGASSLGGLLGASLSSQVSEAVAEARRRAGIRSPSEMTAVLLGVPLMEGIAAGVERGQGVLAAALRKSIRGAINRAGFERFSQVAQQVFSGMQGAATTPAEREIAAIERRRELADLQRALTEAADPAAVARAQEDLRLFQLREQAERERTLLEQRQFLVGLNFQRALDRLGRQIEKGDLTAAQERRRVRRFIHQFNLNIKGGGLSLADKRQLAKELGPYFGQAIGYVVEAQ